MDGEEIKIPSASEFLAAFYPAVATGVICLTIFPLIRSHFPDVYDPKRERVRLGGSKHQRGDVANMPPELPKFTLDWLKLLWTFTDEDIVRYCGADTLMFLRFLRLGFKVRACARPSGRKANGMMRWIDRFPCVCVLCAWPPPLTVLLTPNQSQPNPHPTPTPNNNANNRRPSR